MRMNEPRSWPAAATQSPRGICEAVASGAALDVTHQAPRWICGRPVAIEASVYDRFVAWGAAALRRHGQHLDEQSRLDTLLESCGSAACCSSGGCFIFKAIDAEGYSGRIERHVLTMSNLGMPNMPEWIIHS